jgi:protein-tyrosine phosphatase
MSETRHVGWDGFFNARDLGGLPVRGGGRTRRGSLIRSADLRFVTRNGWQQARAAGVRTVVDLRNDEEILPGSDRDAELAGSGQFPAAPFGSAVPGSSLTRELRRSPVSLATSTAIHSSGRPSGKRSVSSVV